jgi:acetylornithine deacetylase/succinyl-diaminopimelate desuccinylase-like protein
VLPAEATAWVDFRLVPDPRPDDVLALLRPHLHRHGFENLEAAVSAGVVMLYVALVLAVGMTAIAVLTLLHRRARRAAMSVGQEIRRGRVGGCNGRGVPRLACKPEHVAAWLFRV